MVKAIDLTGERFGRIVVESFSHQSKTKSGIVKEFVLAFTEEEKQ